MARELSGSTTIKTDTFEKRARQNPFAVHFKRRAVYDTIMNIVGGVKSLNFPPQHIKMKVSIKLKSLWTMDLRELKSSRHQRSYNRERISTWDDRIARWLTGDHVDPEEIVSILIDEQMLPAEKRCPRCNKPLRLWKAKNNVYNYMWYCRHKKVKKAGICKFTTSIRTGTIFAASKLTLPEQMYIINGWLKGETLRTISTKLNISNHGTVPRLIKQCRDVSLALSVALSDPIGGPGKTVEIDESLFGKRKYNKGKFKRSIWVFAGVERGTNKCFLVPVKQRNKTTLLSIIKEWILPGTTIVSDDCRRAYRNIPVVDELNYEHFTVDHAVAFVNPINGAHTNTIEGLWSQLKRGLARGGRRPEHLEAYFARFLLLRMMGSQSDHLTEFIRMANSFIEIGVNNEIVHDEVRNWPQARNVANLAQAVSPADGTEGDDSEADNEVDDDDGDAAGELTFEAADFSLNRSSGLSREHQGLFEDLDVSAICAGRMLEGSRLLVVRRSLDGGRVVCDKHPKSPADVFYSASTT